MELVCHKQQGDERTRNHSEPMRLGGSHARPGRGAPHLNGLPMLPEHVHSDHSFVKLRIEGLNDLIIKVLLWDTKKNQRQT